MWLFLAFAAVPIIEIGLFIEVGGWLGLWPTIGIVILTAVTGSFLMRTQGLSTLAELKGKMGRGEDPSALLAHGALILVAGILLLTPGFFTDAVGLSLLLPPVRAAVISRLAGRVAVMAVRTGGAGGGFRAGPGPAGGGVVDGEYEDVTPGQPGDDGPEAPRKIAGRDET